MEENNLNDNSEPEIYLIVWDREKKIWVKEPIKNLRGILYFVSQFKLKHNIDLRTYFQANEKEM